MDSLALLPAAVEGGDWQDIRELVERTGEALRLSSVSSARIPELAQLFLRLSRHENWQVRKAVAHAALYLRHDLFHGIVANLIDDDNLWVRDIARKTLVRRSELSRAEVQAQDPFDADAALLDEIESRYGVKARRSVVAAASKLHHRFVKEVYHEIIRILSPLDTCLVNLERELSGKPGLEQAADRIRRGHHHVGLITEVLDNLREFTDGKPAETTRECLSSILKEAVSLAQQGACVTKGCDAVEFHAGAAIQHTPDYREVWFRGECFMFGSLQAEVVRMLHEASKTGKPWVSGKSILAGVGSKDREFKIANLFRKHKSWKRLVLSNGRGDYRLADA